MALEAFLRFFVTTSLPDFFAIQIGFELKFKFIKANYMIKLGAARKLKFWQSLEMERMPTKPFCSVRLKAVR
jgi:hypothetical protein